jgi:hypothetical protein
MVAPCGGNRVPGGANGVLGAVKVRERTVMEWGRITGNWELGTGN